MDALTPPPLPQCAEPAKLVGPAPGAGPVCGACDEAAVVNWRRRPTDDEIAEHVAAEKYRREQVLLLADPQLPAPEFGPLPTGDDMTRTLYACADHAIGIDEAALVHASTCTAPNETGQHGCDCTPEPHPETDPEPVIITVEPRLPAHWLPGAD